MDLLARREHSYRELIQKLLLRFIDVDLIRKAVDQLRDERLQSDYRFAETYLYSRSQRLFGPQRIRAELRERGIADDIVATVFAEAQIDWSANQLKLLRTKFGEKSPIDFAEKAKRLRFLHYRGFSGGTDE